MSTARIHRRSRSVSGALIGAALLVVGCGGASESESAAESSPGQQSAPGSVVVPEPASESESWADGLDEVGFAPEVVATVDALIASHGDAALEVLLYALERGYTAEQIEHGAADDVVASDGSFADGTLPDAAPAGVVELPVEDQDDGDGSDEESAAVGHGPMALRSAPSDEAPLTVDQLRRSFGSTGVEPDRVLALVIVGLARDGYTLEQITDAIVFGTGVPVPTSDFEERHICLFDPSGVLIVPGVPIGDNPICADRTIGRSPAATTSNPDPEPEAPAASAQSEWSIEVPAEPSTDDEFGLTTYEPTKILITRTPGTDTFIMSASTGRTNVDDRYTDDGFNEITCTREFGDVYSGTGTFDPANPELIVFVGELFTEDVITDCPNGADNSFSRPGWEIVVRVTPEGLSGGFYPADFVIPGEMPTPIAG